MQFNESLSKESPKEHFTSNKEEELTKILNLFGKLTARHRLTTEVGASSIELLAFVTSLPKTKEPEKPTEAEKKMKSEARGLEPGQKLIRMEQNNNGE